MLMAVYQRLTFFLITAFISANYPTSLHWVIDNKHCKMSQINKEHSGC